MGLGHPRSLRGTKGVAKASTKFTQILSKQYVNYLCDCKYRYLLNNYNKFILVCAFKRPLFDFPSFLTFKEKILKIDSFYKQKKNNARD